MKVNISSVLNMLNPTNTGTYNRAMAHAIGLQEAIVYSSLVAKFVYYNSVGRLDNEGYFFSTSLDLEESTTFSRYQQDKCIDTLKELGLIDVQVKGMPSKRHFKIIDNTARIEEILKQGLEKIEQRFQKTDNQECKELENKGSKNLKQNISNINLSKETKEEKQKNKKEDLVLKFEELWKLYPKERRIGKQHAFKSFATAMKNKSATFEEIEKGINDYNAYIKHNKIETKFIKQAGTWFHQNCWQDDYTYKAAGSEIRKDIFKGGGTYL